MGRKILISAIMILYGLINVSVPAVAEEVSAKGAVVIEAQSGRILYEKNIHEKLPMASTTKIMTAIVALEQGNPDDIVKISAKAEGTEGSSMYLKQSEKMTLKELLYGLMLASGNDAAVAIAEHLGGDTAFVEQMNKKALEIGAENTRFANPNGLPDENHYSTAYDMAKITAYGLKNPDFAEIVATKTYRISGEGKEYPRNLVNHNKLLSRCRGCIGVKTGFTKAAGRCLVSAARRENMTLICVTLNDGNDWDDHCRLYDSMYDKYEMKQILDTKKNLGFIEVLNSDTTALPFSAAEDYCYPMREGEEYSVSVEAGTPCDAPVENKKECGKISVRIGNEVAVDIPAVVNGTALKRNILDELSRGLKYNLERIYKIWFSLSF